MPVIIPDPMAGAMVLVAGAMFENWAGLKFLCFVGLGFLFQFLLVGANNNSSFGASKDWCIEFFLLCL